MLCFIDIIRAYQTHSDMDEVHGSAGHNVSPTQFTVKMVERYFYYIYVCVTTVYVHDMYMYMYMYEGVESRTGSAPVSRVC